MDFFAHDCGTLSAAVNISRFRGQDGVDEYHLVVRPTAYGSIETQLGWVFDAYRNALVEIGLDVGTAVFRRFFCSDVHNQADALKACVISDPGNTREPCAVSWVGQPPMPPAKVELWAYHIADVGGGLKKTQKGSHLTLERGELSHHWTTGLTCPAGSTSAEQTHGILDQYVTLLGGHGMSLSDNLIRTWLFVQNIDANYQGLVVARREFFAAHGLTRDTHFIASSGIEGTNADVAARVTLDAYAISGLRAGQVRFLTAPEHLSPTHVYGVTFERGTSIAYQDRKHIYLSGTASIDHRGNILYPGNVSRQLDRTLENMAALLENAGAGLEDMCGFIVYIRDPSDEAAARRRMRERFGDAPVALVVAPVCRPGWLIELEGMAVIPAANPDLPAF